MSLHIILFTELHFTYSLSGDIPKGPALPFLVVIPPLTHLHSRELKEVGDKSEFGDLKEDSLDT